MDNSDYHQKIQGLLQDQKSLNALFTQVTDQISTHDPEVQQLDDKLSYTLHALMLHHLPSMDYQ